ncbi:MAG: hypothetical protein GY810_25730 [Aureispira sp.]|nr:hypothetical protein [Aureispira sp.]
MRFSDDLYQLIHSLSQSEKRYVKLVAKAFTSKGTDNQLDLFNAFDRQKESNEEKIRVQFKDRIPARNFHVAKNRLYNLILRALYLFHAKNSYKEKINQMYFQADVLRQKGLYKQCDALLEKGIQQAKSHEDYLLATNGLGKLAASYQDQRDVQKIKKYLDEDLKQEYEFIENYKNDITYYYLQLKTLFLTHKKRAARSEEEMDAIKIISDHPLLQDETLAKSARAKDVFWFLNGFIARYKGDYEKASEYWGHFVKAYDIYDRIPKAKITNYVADVNNLMFLELEALLFETADKTCQKLEQFLEEDYIQSDPFLTVKIKERIFEFRLEYYVRSYKYKEALDYLSQHQDELDAIYPQVGKFRILVLDYVIACIHICNAQFDEASKFLDQVFENKIIKEHEYIYAGAMILNLIVHFELGNYQLLDSMLLNTYRMMYKRKLLYKTERIIFKYLKKYLHRQSKQTILDSFILLKQELQELVKNKFERSFLPNVDLVVWIESKIQNKPMLEIASTGGLSLEH